MRLHPYELMYFALSINNISHLYPEVVTIMLSIFVQM